MKVRFIHAADIHLGYEQYHLERRADDFAAAFFGVANHAIDVSAQFVLIAGDLFHRANADAWMLRQARFGLERLRDAHIPVVAIEGNHDMQHARKHMSWVEYLCDAEQLLMLLDVDAAPNGYRALVPWDEQARRGSYVDLAGVRIYGMKYYGAMTARFLSDVADQVERGPDGYTVFMMHSGMQGQVPHMHGGLTPNELSPIRSMVDYVALGHVHKRLELENWVFNPGSTETNSMDEMDWPHGFFDVEVDTTQQPVHRVTPVPTETLRPFRRISVMTDETSTLSEFLERVQERLEGQQNVPEGAVLELHLGGTASFKRQDVPIAELTALAQVRFSPLVARVRNALVPPGDVTVRHGERLHRSDLERQVIEHLVRQQGEYRNQTAAWTRLILDVKNMAAEKDLPDSIVSYVQEMVERLDREQPAGSSPAEHNESQPLDGRASILFPEES